MRPQTIQNLEQIIGQVDDEFDQLESEETMPSYIVKFPCDGVDYYLLWSSVVDAPVTYGMTLAEFEEYYALQYGISEEWSSPLRIAFDKRMERVEKSGTSDSICRDPVEQWIECNRAGENQEQLTFDEIVEKWVREPRIAFEQDHS